MPVYLDLNIIFLSIRVTAKLTDYLPVQNLKTMTSLSDNGVTSGPDCLTLVFVETKKGADSLEWFLCTVSTLNSLVFRNSHFSKEFVSSYQGYTFCRHFAK